MENTQAKCIENTYLASVLLGKKLGEKYAKC